MKQLDRTSCFMRHVSWGTSGCILWTGAISDNGYGRFGSGGCRGKLVQAHRWAYELVMGPIPEGCHIDHLCRTRHCVNPNHMEAVSPQENWTRGNRGKVANFFKRYARSSCKRGHVFKPSPRVDRLGNTYEVCMECESIWKANTKLNRQQRRKR